MVLVKISVCRFIIRERLKFRYDKRLKFRYDILAKSTIVCGLFDFFALWLARDVSPAAGELRFDDLW